EVGDDRAARLLEAEPERDVEHVLPEELLEAAVRRRGIELLEQRDERQVRLHPGQSAAQVGPLRADALERIVVRDLDELADLSHLFRSGGSERRIRRE